MAVYLIEHLTSNFHLTLMVTADFGNDKWFIHIYHPFFRENPLTLYLSQPLEIAVCFHQFIISSVGHYSTLV